MLFVIIVLFVLFRLISMCRHAMLFVIIVLVVLFRLISMCRHRPRR